MDPTGFEPVSATFAECCVSITPRAHGAMFRDTTLHRKGFIHKMRGVVPKREGYFETVARIFFLTVTGSVSHAVLNTSLGARSRIFIR
jgi:hypothetical protein